MATSESGYVGGMPYAVALGWDLDDWRLAGGLERPVRAEAAALLGTSDLDRAEIEALERHPMLHASAASLGEPGAVAHMGAALQARAQQTSAWYLHVDLDVAGPEEVPGGLTPAPAWMARAQLLDAIGAAARALPVRVASLATYNAAADPSHRGARFAQDVARSIVLAISGRTSERQRI
jgi:arginase